MLKFRRFAVLFSLMTIAGLLVVEAVNAGSRKKVIRRLSIIKDAKVVALFDGISDKQLSATVAMKNEKQGTAYIQNKTDQPLTVEVPESVGAVHVLKQVFGDPFNGNQNNNQNQNQNNNQNQGGGQPVGGAFSGFGGNPLGGSQFGNGNQQGGGGVSAFGNPGAGGPGGGLFSIPPESTVALKLDSVCLAHGRPTPKAGMKYELRPINHVVEDKPALARVLANFDRSARKRKAVQAAAWHLANGMSWQQLSAKSIRVLGQPVSNYFSKSDIAAAKQMVKQATKNRPKHRCSAMSFLTTATSKL